MSKLKDFELKEAYSEERHNQVFDIGGKIFRKRNEAYSSYCDFITIASKGSVDLWDDRACHASMCYDHWCLTSPNLCVNYLKDKAHLYWAWLVKESPWADVFLSKNPDLYLTKGLMLHTDKGVFGHGRVLGAAIATRSLTEHVGHTHLWFDLVERGCDPTYAYAIALSFGTEGVIGDKGITPDKIVYPTRVNHGGITPYNWSCQTFANWMNRNCDDKVYTAEKSFGAGTSNPAFWQCVGNPPSVKSTGRFGSSDSNSYRISDLIDFFVENESAILSKCCPDYVKRPLGAELPPIPVKPKPKFLIEPEGDL